MFRRVWCVRVFAVLGLLAAGRRGFAQMAGTIPTIEGSVVGTGLSGSGEVVAELSGQTGGFPVLRSMVGPDGAFQFNNVAPGTYSVRIVHYPTGTMVEKTVTIESSGERLDLALAATKRAPASGVSVDQLRQPLSPKAFRMLETAQADARLGDHLKAVEELRLAVNERSAAPYAHAILGTEYIRLGQVNNAVAELEQAVRLLPHDQGVQSNLGYALCLSGEKDRAELEVRRALELDGKSPQARFLMGAILLSRGAGDQPAIEHLEFARRDVPSARLVLATTYARQGQMDAARQAMAEYLGNTRSAELPRALVWLESVASLPLPPDPFRIGFGQW
jgi:Tfp pilus assembly protein PilF